ncbi:MAG: LarC family nickel insertion protein [Promethearchaeota archaeon]
MAHLILQFDCHSGISGDMILSAFHDLLSELSKENGELVSTIDTISHVASGVEEVRASFTTGEKCGIAMKELNLTIKETITSESRKPHEMLIKLRRCIDNINFTNPGAAIAFADKVFNIILNAEKSVHGIEDEPGKNDGHGKNSHLHFHELASVDTLIDIIGATKALDLLGFFNPTNDIKVHASPINVGRGTVHIQHGLVPVPAPATSKILKNHELLFFQSTRDRGEMATPTGVAILAALKPDFSSINFPVKLIADGHGGGSKDFDDLPNILKISLLERYPEALISGNSQASNDVKNAIAPRSPFIIQADEKMIVEVMVDDISPEDLGFLIEKTYDIGASEVYYSPVHVKKSRVGFEIKILVDRDHVSDVVFLWLHESTTLGCRVNASGRVILARKMEKYPVKLQSKAGSFDGEVSIKKLELKESAGDELANFVEKPSSRPLFKIEHDDLVSVANSLQVSINEARNQVLNYIEKKVKPTS